MRRGLFPPPALALWSSVRLTWPRALPPAGRGEGPCSWLLGNWLKINSLTVTRQSHPCSIQGSVAAPCVRCSSRTQMTPDPWLLKAPRRRAALPSHPLAILTKARHSPAPS